MRKLHLALLALAAAAPLASAQIYVSPHGSDSQPGTVAQPVRTLQHALALRRTSGASRILLESGTYRLSSPLVLTAEDSGVHGHNLLIAAMPGAHPVLSGAVRIEHWREVDAARNLWAATVPASVTNSLQLYVNGNRAFRTQGRVPVALKETSTGYIAANDTLAHWKNPSDMEFVYTGGNDVWSERSEGIGAWTQPRCPIAAIDGTRITMAEPCWRNSTKRVMLPSGARTANLVGPMSVGHEPSYMENAYELLGTPGQWYFDRPSHTLYYVPRPGEDLATADVEMPVLQTLVEGNGTAQAPVRNMVFRGIEFAYATWLGPGTPEGFSAIQATYQVTGPDGYSRQALCNLVPDGACPFGAWTPAPANVEFRYAHHIQFIGDDFVHLGAAGLALRDGSQDDVVRGCIFTDISGNGVDLGGVDKPLAPIAEFTARDRIEDNLFRDVGATYRGGIPVVTGYARNSVIAHNEIDHIPYAAISMGWGGWPDKIHMAGQANNSANNVVRDNRIHDLMLVLADGGGIYTQGLTGPNVANGEKVAGNVIYNQFSSGHALYTDNGSSMITVRGNVVVDANMDNWGSRHHNYYNGQDGSTYDPLVIEDNYWQQGDANSSGKNVTVRNNHIIQSLAQAPPTIVANAGPQPQWRSALEQRIAQLMPSVAPEPPSRVAASASDGMAYVTFSPPVNNGGSAVTSYTVKASTGQTAQVSAAAFAHFAYMKFPDLDNGRPVSFTVTATNANGISEPSLPSAFVTPDRNSVAPPAAPARAFALPGEYGEVSIHFQAPKDEQRRGNYSPLLAYVVTVHPDGEAHPGDRVATFTGRNVVTLQNTRHTTFDVISGLKPGTYTFSVAAVNAAGKGAATLTPPVTLLVTVR